MLLRNYLFFLVFISLCLPAHLCNACCLDKDVRKLKKDVREVSKLMPVVLQAAREQSLNSQNPQDHALLAFVTQVVEPALNQFNEVLGLLLANPWMEKASEPLVKEIQLSNPELPSRSSGSLSADCQTVRKLMTLYKNKLDERHPQPCTHCAAGCMKKAGRCHFLHEAHEAMVPIIGLLQKGANMESENPNLLALCQKLWSDVQAGNLGRSSHRQINSEPNEDAHLLDIKRPE